MEQVDTALTDLTDVIRRTVGARTRDAHLIEDVTQETLVRVAEARTRLTDDALRGYAIVTARNTLSQHFRNEATARRHAHRLVEYRSFDGPEQLTLEHEETDALAVALSRLDPADRDLLLADEVNGTSPSELAADHHTSVRAISMRLARARAALRVEFVLAMRGINDVPVQCRNTLHALSAGDRRRQRELDTDGHLARCSSCADLAKPVEQRRRSIAAWLLIPLAEAIRRAGNSLRHNRATQMAAVAVAVSALTVGYLALRPTDTAPPETATASVAPGSSPRTAAPDTTVPVQTTAPTAAAQAPPVDPCLDASGAQVIDAATDGCVFDLAGASVLAVPADEGFWISAPDGAPAWVHLVGGAESPITIQVGNVVDLRGTVRSHTASPDNAGAPQEQIAALQVRTAHLEVAYPDITVE